MTVEDLFRQLSFGELSNLSIAVDATGTIKKDQHNRVLHFANEGLKALHTRYALIEESRMVTMTGDVEEELGETCLQVISILTAMGESLSFETRETPKKIYYSAGILYIPWVDLGLTENSELQVNMQMRHPILDPVVSELELQQEIAIIAELEEALTAYIGWKMYGNMNTADAMQAAAMNKARYEQVLSEASALGLLPGETLPLQKFEGRAGFESAQWNTEG